MIQAIGCKAKYTLDYCEFHVLWNMPLKEHGHNALTNSPIPQQEAQFS